MSAYTYRLLLARCSDYTDAEFAIEAIYDKEVVGYLVMGTHNEIMDNLNDYMPDYQDTWCEAAGTSMAWLERIHVDVAHRRKGIASVLLKKALRRLKRTGFDAVFVTAFALDESLSQAALIAFYFKHGFVFDGDDLYERAVLFARLRE